MRGIVAAIVVAGAAWAAPLGGVQETIVLEQSCMNCIGVCKVLQSLKSTPMPTEDCQEYCHEHEVSCSLPWGVKAKTMSKNKDDDSDSDPASESALGSPSDDAPVDTAELRV